MSTVARIKRSLEGCRPRTSLRINMFEDGFCFDLFGFLIALPFLDRYRYAPHELMESWGIYYFERAVWLCWGRHTKALHMPWTMEHMKCEVLRGDGTWVPYIACYETGDDGRKQESFAYHYELKSGEIQERIATVYTERREWRQRWLKWCPLFAHRCQSISVEFNDEVGERSGSWKGGTVGCGYDVLPGETAEQTLRRMEREREF